VLVIPRRAALRFRDKNGRTLMRVWVITCGLLLACPLASCERAHSESVAGAAPAARTLRIVRGSTELRGSVVARDDRSLDAEIVLDVRSPTRRVHAQYRYRLSVPLASSEPLELCMRERHMYALLPRDGRSWSSWLASGSDLERGLELVRLDGAGEED
jgi:hypothetical protein